MFSCLRVGLHFRFFNMVHSANKAKAKELKDQDAPKRPLNPYMMFCSQEREKVQEEIGSKNMGQVTAELSKRWAALDVEVKNGFHLESKKKKEKYEEELKAYKPSEEFLKRKAEVEANNAGDVKAKKLKDKDAPKMASNPYIIFCRKERQNVQKELACTDKGQVMSELGKRWAALDADAKAVFELESKKEKERYEEEMKVYQPSEEFLKKKADLESAKAGCSSEQQTEEYFTFLLMHWRQVAINKPTNTGLEIQEEVWQMWLAQGSPVVKEGRSNDAEPKSKKQKKAPRDPREPKRPPSSFLLFCQGQRSEGGQIGRAEVSARWSALSEEEKEPHVTRANALLQEYKAATKKFKEEMVGKGVDELKESVNMNSGEKGDTQGDNTEGAADVRPGQVDVEGAEADGDEKAD